MLRRRFRVAAHCWTLMDVRLARVLLVSVLLLSAEAKPHQIDRRSSSPDDLRLKTDSLKRKLSELRGLAGERVLGEGDDSSTEQDPLAYASDDDSLPPSEEKRRVDGTYEGYNVLPVADAEGRHDRFPFGSIRAVQSSNASSATGSRPLAESPDTKLASMQPQSDGVTGTDSALSRFLQSLTNTQRGAQCPKYQNQDRFPCPAGPDTRFVTCIYTHQLCDGHQDCPGGEDESRTNCLFYTVTNRFLKSAMDIIIDLSDLIQQTSLAGGPEQTARAARHRKNRRHQRRGRQRNPLAAQAAAAATEEEL